MESPVIIDKPPEYHGNAKDNERGFPFDEEEGSGAWSELAARHPDIAARLRQRPATWARKRRPSSQDATDDFGESFSGFDRFPFDDIPPEFREHFPTHWNRRYSARDEPDRTQPAQAAPSHATHAPHTPHAQPAQTPQPASPQHSTAATQTEPGPPEPGPQPHLPQYGLRNTVDLGQRSQPDPSLVDADDRAQRSMSEPPHGCAPNQGPSRSTSRMSANHQEHAEPPQQPANVRHIPIFVEGRDEPVINKSVDHGTHFGDAKPAYAPPPQPHVDRDQYFDEGPAFHPPPNFSRAFGTPFNKGFRQGPQPFVQQKVYPQAAFARGASPQRSQSPKPPSPQMHPDEHYVKVPVHHDHAAPRPEPRPQHKPPPPQQQPQQQPPQPQQQQPAAPRQETPPPPPRQPNANDPITQILSIQTDVLNLMSEVENFTGTKKDKRYLFLDEMLTRNLIKLDNIETDGKENIRLARKEAIKCIQKCIAVLEAKADKGGGAAPAPDVDMSDPAAPPPANGDADASEAPEAEDKAEAPAETQPKESQDESKASEAAEAAPAQAQEAAAPDTRPDAAAAPAPPDNDQELDKKASPKKAGKSVKKRDKSKDSKDKDSKDSNKEPTEERKEEMQVDDRGDAPAPAQAMDVDGAASQ